MERFTLVCLTSIQPGRRIRSLNVKATSESLNFALNPFSDTYSQVLPVGFAEAWLLSLLYMAANHYLLQDHRPNDGKRTWDMFHPRKLASLTAHSDRNHHQPEYI